MLRNKMRVWILFIFTNGIIKFSNAQCGNDSYNISGGSGSIRSPDSKDKGERCLWNFSLHRRPQLLLLKVNQMKLYYRPFFFLKTCTQSLKVGNYSITTSESRCESESSFCRVIYNDGSCKGVASTWSAAENCEHFFASSTAVEFTSTGERGLLSDAEGFQMSYQYVNCTMETTVAATSNIILITHSPETTALTSTASILTGTNSEATNATSIYDVVDMSTTSFKHDITAETSFGKSETTTSIAVKQRGLNRNIIIGAVIGCSIILLLLVALMIYRMRAMNQRKHSQGNGSHELDERETAEIVNSIAYGRIGDNGTFLSGDTKSTADIEPTEAAEIVYSAVYGKMGDKHDFKNDHKESPSESTVSYYEVVGNEAKRQGLNAPTLSHLTTQKSDEGDTLSHEEKSDQKTRLTEIMEGNNYSVAADDVMHDDVFVNESDPNELSGPLTVDNVLYGTR